MPDLWVGIQRRIATPANADMIFNRTVAWYNQQNPGGLPGPDADVVLTDLRFRHAGGGYYEMEGMPISGVTAVRVVIRGDVREVFVDGDLSGRSFMLNGVPLPLVEGTPSRAVIAAPEVRQLLGLRR